MTDPNKNKEELRENSALWVQYVKALGGTIVLVVAISAAFWVTDGAKEALSNWVKNEILLYLIAGFILATMVYVIGGLFVLMIDYPVIRVIYRCANYLSSATTDLKIVLNGTDDDPGLLQETKEILEDQKRLKNIGQIVLLEEFGRLQKRFVEITEINEEANNLELRIVGTMLGTYGENRKSLDLASSLIDHNVPANMQRRPFKEAHFCVPGHNSDLRVGSPNGKGDRSLYPFSARVIAGDILLKLNEKWSDRQRQEKLREDLRIHVHFVPQIDIFPAVQLWGDKCAMVLCSTGTKDRMNDTDTETITAVTDAMPVALVLKQRSKLHGLKGKSCELNITLERIKEHLVYDYESENKETWILDSNTGEFRIENYRVLFEEREFLNRAGCFLEEKEVDYLENVFEYISKSGNVRFPIKISDDTIEFKDLISRIKKTTEIIASPDGALAESSFLPKKGC